jgi:hypothetical protein
MEEEHIRSTESMSEYLTQVSVRSQSTIFTDAMRETQDFNLDPIQEVSIRDSTPTDTYNPRVRRFSSFGEESKDLSAIDSDEEEEGQEEVQNSTIQKGKLYSQKSKSVMLEFTLSLKKACQYLNCRSL